jgi:hypothetical protein
MLDNLFLYAFLFSFHLLFLSFKSQSVAFHLLQFFLIHISVSNFAADIIIEQIQALHRILINDLQRMAFVKWDTNFVAKNETCE